MKLHRMIILTIALLIAGESGTQAQQPGAKDLYFGYAPRTERRQRVDRTPVRLDRPIIASRINTRRNSPPQGSHTGTRPQPNSSGSNGVSPSSTGLPGTRITIELSRKGKMSFVSPGYKFKSGDKIRLRLKTNFEGYVSVLNLGSSGRVNLLYPVQDRNGDYLDNYVMPTDDYQIPQNDAWIVFDDRKGTETVTVIMSTYPMQGFNNLERNSYYFRKDRTSKDLFVQTAGSEIYAVCPEETLDGTVGFTLKFRHS